MKTPFVTLVLTWLDELLGLPDGELNQMLAENRTLSTAHSPADLAPPERNHAHGSIAVPLPA